MKELDDFVEDITEAKVKAFTEEVSCCYWGGVNSV